MPDFEGVHLDRRRLVRMLMAACLVGATLLLSSCIDDGDGFPDIVSLTVSPSSIPQSDTGMTDETIDVTITVADFTGEIVEADVFLQLGSEEREAQYDTFDTQGDTIELYGITKSFFGGLQPGDYQLGATVVSDAGERVEELDLATVSITP